MIYVVGAQPGRGTYACMDCRWWVHLNHEAQLPPCGKCGQGEQTRYCLAARAFADYRSRRSAQPQV